MAKSKKKTASSSSDKSEILTEHLLDVAASFFLEKGFAGSSVSEMARHARASKESFYSRYPTKEELFRAVIRRQTDRMSERTKALFLSEAFAVPRIDKVVARPFHRSTADIACESQSKKPLRFHKSPILCDEDLIATCRDTDTDSCVCFQRQIPVFKLAQQSQLFRRLARPRVAPTEPSFDSCGLKSRWPCMAKLRPILDKCMDQCVRR